MDNQSMPDQPIPGTEEYGARTTPIPVVLEDENQAVTTVIENIRSGQFSLEAGALLSQLVNACVTQSAKGKLTIEIEVKAEEGQDWVALAATAKAAMPKMVWAAVMYPDDSGRLTRNPNQQSFFG